MRPDGWLESADVLLTAPSPGPTPFLVDGVLVDGALGAIAGAPKVGKTWIELALAVAIVTGEPVIGRSVPIPGPAIVVLEESGRDALNRRLGAIARGHGIEPSALAGLHFSANARVRLDDPDWQEAITRECLQIKPRAIFFDPLVRLKDPGRDENEQKSMAPLIDFMRKLRDDTLAAPIFVHHLSKVGGTMRGSGDLESVWESRLSITRERNTIRIVADHREAEPSAPLEVTMRWSSDGQSVTFETDRQGHESLTTAVLSEVVNEPGLTTETLVRRVGRRAKDVRAAVAELELTGRIERRAVPASGRPPAERDGSGRPKRSTGWHPASRQGIDPVPTPGTAPDGNPRESPSTSNRPVPIGTDGGRDGSLGTSNHQGAKSEDPYGDQGDDRGEGQRASAHLPSLPAVIIPSYSHKTTVEEDAAVA